MEILTALVTEKWMLSAVALLWALVERKERLADKAAFRVQREDFIKRLDTLSEALLIIKERLSQ